MLRGIIKGGGLILLSVAFSKLFSIIYIPVLVRVLGPTNLGLYSLALTMLPWFVTLVSLSLSTIVAQAIAENSKYKERLPIIITIYVVFTLVLSLIGGLAHLLLAKTIALELFHSSELIKYLQLVSGGIAIAIFYNTILGIARGLKDFKVYFQMEVMKSFVMVVLGLLFLLVFRYGVQGALVAVILAPVISIVGLLWKHRQYLRKALNFNVIHANIYSGFWITILGLILTMLVTADRFLLGVFTDPKTVGFYAAVTTIMTAISLIASSFKGSALPFISENFTEKEKIRATMQSVVSYTLLLVGLLLLVLVAFREEIILLAFGKEFAPSIPLVPLLGVTLLPFTIYILMHTVILDRRLVAYATKILIPIALVALGIDMLLIKKFSMTGAAIGLFISHALVATTYMQILRRKFDLRVHRIVGLSFLIISGVLLATILPSSWWYKIPLFGVLLLAYVIIVWMFRFVTRREIDVVRERIKKFWYLRR